MSNIKIGITERGDPALDDSWKDKMKDVDGVIIITKNPQRLSEYFLNMWHKIVLHVTCTGFGGSVVEPRVPKPKQVLEAVEHLLLPKYGVNPQHIVLRIDPILPIGKGIECMVKVLDMFRHTSITRVRFSFMDMYPHVLKRLANAGLEPPWKTFHAPEAMVGAAMDRLEEATTGRYELSCCGEAYEATRPYAQGCISPCDIRLLTGQGIAMGETSKQRKSCLCLACKTELLEHRGQCGHGCLYCYWK